MMVPKSLLLALVGAACQTSSPATDGPGGDDTDGGEEIPCEFSDLSMAVSTLAGCSQKGMVDGSRELVRFSNPVNVVIASSTVTYVADFDNNRIRAVELSGAARTIVQDPAFARPFGLALAPDGVTMYVETDDNPEMQHTLETGTVWRVNVNTGQAAVIVRDVGRPRGLDVLTDGRIAMADHMHHVVSILDPDTGVVTPLAGQRDLPGHVNGPGASAQFAQPYDVVQLGNGDLLVSDMDNHRLRRITLAGMVTDFAGTGAAGDDDGPLGVATFHAPQGLAIDGDGTLYVSDVVNRTIRRIIGGDVSTIAGDGTPGFQDTDQPLTAKFFGLEGIDALGDRLVAADGNIGDNSKPYNRVRMLYIQKL